MICMQPLMSSTGRQLASCGVCRAVTFIKDCSQYHSTPRPSQIDFDPPTPSFQETFRKNDRSGQNIEESESILPR